MDAKFADIQVPGTAGTVKMSAKGCCTKLAPLLKRKNLELIMEIMKFSIGSTIPSLSLYTNTTIPVSESCSPESMNIIYASSMFNLLGTTLQELRYTNV